MRLGERKACGEEKNEVLGVAAGARASEASQVAPWRFGKPGKSK